MSVAALVGRVWQGKREGDANRTSGAEETLAILVHTAYHLGAVRQALAVIRERAV